MYTNLLAKADIADDSTPNSAEPAAARVYVLKQYADVGKRFPTSSVVLRHRIFTSGGALVSAATCSLVVWFWDAKAAVWLRINSTGTLVVDQLDAVIVPALYADARVFVQVTNVTSASGEDHVDVGVVEGGPVSGEIDVAVTGSAGLATEATVAAISAKLPSAAALSDTTSNPTTTLVGAMNEAWDSVAAKWKRWLAIAMNSDAIADPGTMPIVGAFAAAWDAAASKWRRLLTDSNGRVKIVDGPASAASTITVVAVNQTTFAAVPTSAATQKGVIASADLTNTDVVEVGFTGTAVGDGMQLNKGDSIFLPVANANVVYATSASTGQKLRISVL